MKAWLVIALVCLVQMAALHAAIVGSKTGTTCSNTKCNARHHCEVRQVECVAGSCNSMVFCIKDEEEKPGTCPMVLMKKMCIQGEISTCKDDSQCMGPLRCCNNGCINECTEPIFPNRKR